MTNRFNFLLAFYLSVVSVLVSCCKEENNDNINETITDIDGNVYNTVTIGSQIWLKENLKTTKYNDGTDIPLVTDYRTWRDLKTFGYCWYNNDSASYGDTYGALYNWYAINTSKLCPIGWHVPSDEDWTILSDFIGGDNIAGSKLKEVGTAHWPSPNAYATDEYKFTALPGGDRSTAGGLFGFIGYRGLWWTSTSFDDSYAYFRAIYDKENYLDHSPYLFKGTGVSIRCLKGN
jgi:uncharacterized protein (TIGR02145 family)